MKNTAWIGCVCLLALAGCGGASGDDGRETGKVNRTDEDAGRQNTGRGDDDGDDMNDDDADDDLVITPVEDDDVVTIEDDDLFVPVEDDDFAMVEPEPDVANDDDVVVRPDDDRLGDDDAVVDDDVVAPTDDDGVSPDDDVVVDPDDDRPADDDTVMMEPDPGVDPTECQVTGQSLGPTYCQLNELCGSRYRYSYCSDLGNGSWSCQCSNNYQYQYYELSGVDQNTACPAVRNLCDEGITPMFTGDPVCMPAYKSLGSTYCQTSTNCRREADLGNGVKAVETQTSSNYCYDYGYGDGSLNCQCYSNNRGLSYQMSGVPLADSCELGMAMCEGDDSVFTGEPVCTTQSETSNTSYCQVQRNCGRTVDLGDGVVASLNVPENAYCQFSSDGVAICNCSNANTSMRFQMDMAAGPEACTAAGSVCQTTEEIVPEGPLECTRASQSSGTTYCSANIQCAQDAVVNGVTIGVFGNVSVSCSPNGDQWSCSCRSSIDSASLNVAADDGWDACTMASEQCPDLVDVDVTTGGYYYYF